MCPLARTVLTVAASGVNTESDSHLDVRTPNHVFSLVLHSGAPPPHGPVQTSSSTGSGQRAHPSHRHAPTAADTQELPPVPVIPHKHTQMGENRGPLVLMVTSLTELNLNRQTSAEDADSDIHGKQVVKTALQEGFVYNSWGYFPFRMFLSFGFQLLFLLFLLTAVFLDR